jgi:hypothetical protein
MIPHGAAGIEVASENGSTYDQSRQVNLVDSVSAAFDSGLIVHIHQSRASDLSPVHCLPHVEALHMRTSRQISSFLKHVAVQRIIADR